MKTVLDKLKTDAQPAEAITLDDAPNPGDITTEPGMRTFLDVLFKDLQATWTATLPDYTAAYYFPSVWVGTGESVSTGCGEEMTDTKANAYYCPASNKIFVPVGTMITGVRDSTFMNRSVKVPGDAVVAYVVAHEYAHGVAEFFRGWLKTNTPGLQLTLGERDGKYVADYKKGDLPRPNELLADCMAGVWFYSAYYKGMLEKGDLDEAIAATVGLADKPGKIDHGSPAERSAAFKAGYDSGQLFRCMNDFAPILKDGQPVTLSVPDVKPTTPKAPQTPKAPTSTDPLANLTGGSFNLPYDKTAASGLGDIQAVSSSMADFYGFDRPAHVYWYESTDAYTGCGTKWSDGIVGYCVDDTTVVVGSRTMNLVADASATHGELAVELLIARAAAIHISLTSSTPGKINNDCTVGYWLGSAGGHKMSDTKTADVREAFTIIGRIIQPPDFYGTVAVRMASFTKGYEASTSAACAG